MISSDRSCKRLVAGNYDVLINEPLVAAHKSVLTDFLDHFERYENELAQSHQHVQQQQQQQQQAVAEAPKCGYVDEFKLLKELSKALKENKANLVEGEAEQNQRKNRYKDIIPFSHTRVILSCNPDVAAADLGSQLAAEAEPAAAAKLVGQSYINANFIRGPSGSPRAYIACQGPLACTLNDFWRMIWECNVSVVVMACNELESGKPKCELYWPDQLEARHTYGDLRVTLMRVRQINSDFLIRKFSVQLLAPGRGRRDNVKQHRQTSMDGNNNNNNNNNNLRSNNSTTTRTKSDNSAPYAQQQAPNGDTSCYLMQQFSQQLSGLASTTTTAVSSAPAAINRAAFNLSNGNSSASNESISTSDDSSSATNRSHPRRQHARHSELHQHIRNSLYLNQANNSNNIQCQEQPSVRSNDEEEEEEEEEEADDHDEEEGRVVLHERTICQFHYTTWPDHGVPDSVHPILELVRLIREVQPAEDKPILVHCSAGCGRTGTICCIDYVWGLIRSGKLDESFNLCNIISEMRRQRMAMVQTLAQYILCHRAVAALFLQQLQVISLDNNHNHRLEKCHALEQSGHNTSSSIEDSAIEDNERDLDEDEDEDEDDEDDEDEDEVDVADEDGDAREEGEELGPVFI